jgi:hypothetical protein
MAFLVAGAVTTGLAACVVAYIAVTGPTHGGGLEVIVIGVGLGSLSSSPPTAFETMADRRVVSLPRTARVAGRPSRRLSRRTTIH